VLLWNEDGQREAAQKPLGRAFPGRLLVADCDQLTGERQRRLGKLKLTAQLLAQVKVELGDVIPALLEAYQFRVDLGRFVPERLGLDRRLGKPVLAVREFLLSGIPRSNDLPTPSSAVST